MLNKIYTIIFTIKNFNKSLKHFNLLIERFGIKDALPSYIRYINNSNKSKYTPTCQKVYAGIYNSQFFSHFKLDYVEYTIKKRYILKSLLTLGDIPINDDTIRYKVKDNF